eukprot:gene2193-1360_t
MFRRFPLLLIGVEGSAFLSSIKSPAYLQHRLAILGKPDPQQGSSAPLTPEQVQRFTSSLGSAEQLFNKEAGAIPTNVVDEETGRVIGSTQLNPTRYGDWEQHGRCCDF